MNEHIYLIHELAEKTGVSLRTIRFYIEKRLLPEAPVKGRYAAYSEEYVDRIELIKGLKELHMPLEEIRERTQYLTASQVREHLKRLGEQQPKGRRPRRSKQPALPGTGEDSEELAATIRYLNGESLPDGMKPELGGSLWERVEFAEGIELHFRRPLDPRHLRRVQALMDLAGRLFKDSE